MGFLLSRRSPWARSATTIWIFWPGNSARRRRLETRRAIRPLYKLPELGALAAYVIGKVRIARSGDEEFQYLYGLLKSGGAKPQGMALRALAELGDTSWLQLCEFFAIGKPEDRATVRFYALDALRLIGTPDSANRLRIARHEPGVDGPDNSMSMSYDVSEDIFRRCAQNSEYEAGGADGRPKSRR